MISIPADNPYRTHTCAELRKSDVGKKVRLSGWVHNIRDLGGVLFIEIRDHYGITQLVTRPDSPARKTMDQAHKEWVIGVTGTVADRGAENYNRALETGEIDVLVEEANVLSQCEAYPISVFPETPVPEELRLKYRFLDLRRSKIHKNIIFRSRFIASLRERMRALGFNEFNTPILTASTPEGARDYLVPSRLYPGKFYALPQAPQLFKQLLMVSGFDRYFQIAACFRDEDARADRSPSEFYQLDLEMSFVTQEDVFDVVEKVVGGVFEEFADGPVTKRPFPRIEYDTSMLEFGNDKPDLRNPLRIRDVSEIFKGGEFRAYADKIVRAVMAPKAAAKPRSFFDKVDGAVKDAGGEGTGWLSVEDSGKLKGPIAKYVPAEKIARLLEITQAKPGDSIFFYAGSRAASVCRIMAFLRTYLGEALELIDPKPFEFCWVHNYPMFEEDEETRQIIFSHNPFSMPAGGLEALNSKHPLEVKAYQYDLVCNGVEVSSGAIRNHRPDIMYRAFEIAGYPKEEVDRRFGGMIAAFKHGAPPHGGIAPGVDRMIMLLTREKNIREVIAFPMNQNAQDLLMGAPAEVTERQLKELHLQIVQPAVKK